MLKLIRNFILFFKTKREIKKRIAEMRKQDPFIYD